MSFRDNLQHLRDTRNMSQADLAQQLGVSRQSVAKWEAEKSYPEMDKLIKICDLFGCSLDDLVRGDLAGCEAVCEEPATVDESAAVEELAVVDGSTAANELTTFEGSMASEHLEVASEPTVVSEAAISEEASIDVCGYDDHMRRRAWDYAAGVAAVVMGFGAGINFTYTGPGASPLPFIICLAIGVAVALFFVMPARAGHRAFQQEHPHVEDFYTVEQKAEARNTKGGCIAGFVLLVAAGLSVPGLISELFNRFAFAAITMFGCFALAAALAVYAVMMDRRIDVARYNRLSARRSAAEPEAHAGSTAGDTTAG